MMAPNERAGFFIAPPLAPVVWTAVIAATGPFQGISDYFGSVLIVAVLGVPVAYFMAVLLGLPLYLAARRLGRVTLVSCALGGAFVAALPTLIALLVLYRSWEAGRDWRVHGLFAFTGLVVGAVFWVVLREWPYNQALQTDVRRPVGAGRG